MIQVMNGTVMRSVRLSKENDAEVRRFIKRHHWRYSDFVNDAVKRAVQLARIHEYLQAAHAESEPLSKEIEEEARQEAWDLMKSSPLTPER